MNKVIPPWSKEDIRKGLERAERWKIINSVRKMPKKQIESFNLQSS